MEDEISLRDLYLILKERSRVIIGVTLAALLITFAVSKLIPPTYESEAVAQALVTTNDGQAEPTGFSEVFRTLPSGEAMGLGFSKQIKNSGPYVANIIGNSSVKVKSRFDDKKNVLTITVDGRDPAETKQFAEELLAAFDNYVRDQAYASASASLNGALEQARLDTQAIQARIDQLKSSLSEIVGVKASGTTQAALESDGVSPSIARADNPALAYVSLELAKQQTAMASLNSEIQALQQLAANPEQLRRLSEQAARVNVLSPPPLPQEPVSPRPLFNAALAAIMAFILAVFWAFLSAALVGDEASAEPAPASPASPSEAASLRR